MNKKTKVGALLLSSLLANSSGATEIGKLDETVNHEIYDKSCKSLVTRIGIAMGSITALDLGLHAVTHTILYPAPFVRHINSKIHLKSGGSIYVSRFDKKKDNKGIKTVFMCFPGNGYTSDHASPIGVSGFSYKLGDDAVKVGVDYPGYNSDSLWAPLNAIKLTDVAHDAYDWIKSTYPNADIKIYAHSLGGYPGSVLMDKDDIKEFYLSSPVRLDTVLLNSKLVTYALNWENLSFVDNMLKKVPKRKTRCNVFIVSGGHKNETGEFLSLYDTIKPKDGKKIKEKLIDTGKLNLKCQIDKTANHNNNSFSSQDLKDYDILTGKADGDK